jgi:hypothetical protein
MVPFFNGTGFSRLTLRPIRRNIPASAVPNTDLGGRDLLSLTQNHTAFQTCLRAAIASIMPGKQNKGDSA